MSDVPKDTSSPAESVEPSPAPEKLSTGGMAAMQGVSDHNNTSEDIVDVPVDKSAVPPEQVERILGRKSLWKDDSGQPIEPKGKEGRGVDYEKLKGANIGGTFETIDDYDPNTRTATSYKSIDLNAETYKDHPSRSNDIIKGYIDDLSNFQDTTSTQNGRRVEVLRDDIDRYNLSLAIPAGTYSGENLTMLKESSRYAVSKGVNLIVEEVP